MAIYNFTIINLPFPLALYKKLLNEPVDITDLRDLSPTLANSMQSILDYTGEDFEEVFNLNFEVTRDMFGETQLVPLKPDGNNIPVKQSNKSVKTARWFSLLSNIRFFLFSRTEFVELYIDYVLNRSVLKQFQGFSDGFMKVCGGKVMELFRPHELMAVVVGNEDYDWHVLESEAEYRHGYTSGDQTVRYELIVTKKNTKIHVNKFRFYGFGRCSMSCH